MPDIYDSLIAHLEEGANITLDADGNTITIAASGGGGGGATNLSVTSRTSTALTVASDTGTDAVIPAASSTEAGLLVAADKVKLDALPSDAAELIRDTMGTALVAGANVTITPSDVGDTITIAAAAANLSVTTRTSTALTVASDTGTDAVIPAASSTEAGLLVAADKVKLDALPSDAAELIRDTMGTALVAGANVTITPDDTANTITIAASGGGGGGGATNLSVTTRTSTALTVASDTGTDAVIPAASSTEAGLLVAAEKIRLNAFQGITLGLGGQTTVVSNLALGASALNSASLTGTQNIGIGRNALAAATTGVKNTAIGDNCLAALTTSNNCLAIGAEALVLATSGNTSLTAVGPGALRSITTGSYNSTAIGVNALDAATATNSCTAIGADALPSLTTGTQATAIGTNAGTAITTGSSGVYVGYNSTASSSGVSGELVIGTSITGKGANTAFIGGTSGAYNGGNTTTWATTSDRRVKKNISDAYGGLDIIGKLKIRNFEYRTADEITDLPKNLSINKVGVQLGFIAQELREVLPEMVKENAHGFLSVITDDVLFHLVLAVQQLSKQIKEIKNDNS